MRDSIFTLEVLLMSDYEKLTRKANGLILAATECKTPEGQACLYRHAKVIRAVRDSMTVEEAEA
jgi:hypothetical protein